MLYSSTIDAHISVIRACMKNITLLGLRIRDLQMKLPSFAKSFVLSYSFFKVSKRDVQSIEC